MQYELAKEVDKIAKRLIREDFNDLDSKKIVCVFETKKDKNDQAVAQMRKGRAKGADVKIIGGLNAFLISGEEATDVNGPDALVVVTVSKHAWTGWTPEQRVAAIDAQLCKLDFDTETGRPTLIDFDVQAHTRNVKKYGAWNRDLNYFFEAAKQAPLFEGLLEIVEVAEQTASADAKQQAKVLKGNGNGAEKVEPEKSKATGLRELKNTVAQKRGLSRPSATPAK